MSGGVVRTARASDLDDLTAIVISAAETFERYGEPLADDGSPPVPASRWAAYLDRGLLWVAESPDARPIGFLAAELQDGGLYVAEVDVAMAHQRQGHGRQLMAAAIGWARKKGLADVTLTTFRHIPWNAPFYRSLGFVALDEDTMTPHLAAELAHEATLGFQNRCGMRLCL